MRQRDEVGEEVEKKKKKKTSKKKKKKKKKACLCHHLIVAEFVILVKEGKCTAQMHSELVFCSFNNSSDLKLFLTFLSNRCS